MRILIGSAMSRFHVVLFGLRVSDWAKATRQMRAKVNDRDDYQLSGVRLTGDRGLRGSNLAKRARNNLCCFIKFPATVFGWWSTTLRFRSLSSPPDSKS